VANEVIAGYLALEKRIETLPVSSIAITPASVPHPPVVWNKSYRKAKPCWTGLSNKGSRPAARPHN